MIGGNGGQGFAHTTHLGNKKTPPLNLYFTPTLNHYFTPPLFFSCV